MRIQEKDLELKPVTQSRIPVGHFRKTMAYNSLYRKFFLDLILNHYLPSNETFHFIKEFYQLWLEGLKKKKLLTVS